MECNPPASSDGPRRLADNCAPGLPLLHTRQANDLALPSNMENLHPCTVTMRSAQACNLGHHSNSLLLEYLDVAIPKNHIAVVVVKNNVKLQYHDTESVKWYVEGNLHTWRVFLRHTERTVARITASREQGLSSQESVSRVCTLIDVRHVQTAYCRLQYIR